MLKPLKCIATLFLTCFCLTNARSQPNPKADTSTYHQLQLHRQLFWDHLPKPISWTNDYEDLFTGEEEHHLDSLINDFNNKTSIQVCIVTLDTSVTTKEKFDDLALHISNVWGVGQKNKNNGVTICISAGYRRIRICNGNGIQEYLSNSETKKIVDNDFMSQFKNGSYYQGTLNGLIAIISKLTNIIK